MKRRIATMVLTLGVAAVLAAPAFAQQPKRKGGGFGGGFGMGGGAGLLMNEGVQKELKLDSDQVSKVETAVREVREKHQGDFAKLQDLDAQERREKMAELGRTINGETNKALADILKPEQMKRYHQIQRQQMGLLAFTEPEVQVKLKLTDDQVGQIRRIAADNQGQMRELFQPGGGGNREEAMQKIATLRKEGMDKALAVLSADQKDAWKDLTGEPFEVRFQGFGGGPGGGGRRPNN
jgi:hypothetical protein